MMLALSGAATLDMNDGKRAGANTPWFGTVSQALMG